ncbi:hypothetical protein KBD45_01955 [Candidatus Dojkabacteria bacterium]|nr:hypothetical protein [Candidatus Dojkabacteria bacterium]
MDLNIQSELNKINVDRYGIVSAFLAIDKKKWVMSHDIVNQVRKRLGTKCVGHAGALDPFATGVLIILVGKKYTKLSNDLLGLDKTYQMRVLLGVQTKTLDIESEISVVDNEFGLPEDNKIQEVLNSFDGGYSQTVPIYSSVKVNGNKLRVLARGSDSFQIITKENKGFVNFINFSGQNIEIEIPVKEVKLYDIKILGQGNLKKEDLPQEWKTGEMIKDSIEYLDIEFGCSKGTYARQFAADIAEKLGTVGMLVELERSRIGTIYQKDCIEIDKVNYPTPPVY